MSTTISIRAPRFLADGRIDCEIEHPTFGWIPFTANADDTTEHGRAIHAAAIAMIPAPYVAQPPAEPTRAEQVAAIEAQRDATIAAGVEIDGVLYHADTTFLTEMMGRIMGYQAGVYAGALPVRTKANATVLLTQAQHVALAAAVGAHRQLAYAVSWDAKDALL